MKVANQTPPSHDADVASGAAQPRLDHATYARGVVAATPVK
jgi:hypothetical protein